MLLARRKERIEIEGTATERDIRRLVRERAGDWRPVRDRRDRERVREAAELEGALQYPPASVGQDAQPSLPAKPVRQLVFPAAHRIGHQRVKRAARHTIISDPPAGSERGVPARRSR
jgi:hypothetical protein